MCPEERFHRLNFMGGVYLFQKNRLYSTGIAIYHYQKVALNTVMISTNLAFNPV